MNSIAKFTIQILVIISGGLLYGLTCESIDPSFYYLFGFTVGIIAGKIY